MPSDWPCDGKGRSQSQNRAYGEAVVAIAIDGRAASSNVSAREACIFDKRQQEYLQIENAPSLLIFLI
jgi:hypothetical protein